MPVTVIVRPSPGEEIRLTFDGQQRIVLGRGAGSDVRLPDGSVSHRHATLRMQGSDLLVVDENSTNGTFVGDVRVPPHTSRIVPSGSGVRLGRVRLQIAIDHVPPTRDVAAATRDLALAMVADAMRIAGAERTPKLVVVEGEDRGLSLVLVEEERGYVVGRAAHCDLPLADADVSREHVRVTRRRTSVEAEDLGTKNGTALGGVLLGAGRGVTWRPTQMIKMGRTVVALVEPVAQALATIETTVDEVLGAEALVGVGDAGSPDAAEAARPAADTGTPSAAPVPSRASESTDRLRPGEVPARVPRASPQWSAVDLAVMGAALGVLALSLAGIYWLLRAT